MSAQFYCLFIFLFLNIFFYHNAISVVKTEFKYLTSFVRGKKILKDSIYLNESIISWENKRAVKPLAA